MSNIWTLLIADDCAEDREIYREYLLSDPHQSYQILEAASAEVGLELCQKKHCDAILLDFCLPDMSGLEFLDELKQQHLEVKLPVIMLTGQGDERVAVQAMKLGAQDYLVKQHLQPDVLQLTVRNAIQKSHLQNQFSKMQKQQQLAATIALRIRQSFNLEQILQTTAQEVQRLLECDQVTIYQVISNSDHNFTTKSAPFNLKKLCEAGFSISRDPLEKFTAFVEEFQANIENNIQASRLVAHTHKKVPKKTYLLVPILLNDSEETFTKLWGLLVASQSLDKRQWQPDEIDILNELVEHLASTIHQAERFTKALVDLENQKQLNAFKSQFVTTVSCEYRTFLASILAAASTLLQHHQKLDESRNQHFLELIEDKARQMSQLVDNLLVIEKLEFGKVSFTPLPFELLQFFCDIVEEHRRKISDRHQLTFKITGNTRGFWGDQKLLRPIIANLLANAIKYSPEGGNIEVHLMGADSYIVFEVKDEGIGIPIEDQQNLLASVSHGSNFEKIPATGLGLSIVKACVELHGGELRLESHQEQGTKVTVTLPKRPTQI
ncbi:ATP-binding protein [Chlorogloeopsis sp. ULAP01]|uniref:hybrid sensor histidine kinase/response regulator n=1 Tax=Chlorogloeopsis sp. ULAP01 TaxID=3056483 RepID=UPI0025AB2501|nr:ATP-binding protein [Chlorogloeopsis sp. ULAP01]MDM9385669.1 ATP-binding protein [Chlorogloeopsis sp. ULAP01]